MSAPMNSHDHVEGSGRNVGGELDLTLRLGLPMSASSQPASNAAITPILPRSSHVDFPSTLSTQAANDLHAMLTKGGNADKGWKYDANAVKPYGLGNYMGSSVGHHGATTALAANSYAVASDPQAILMQVGSSSGSSSQHAQHQSAVIGYMDTQMRCTNRACNTKDTPMWRKGPLGPKTLCNACGIKYRKAEDKRKGKGKARPSRQG